MSQAYHGPKTTSSENDDNLDSREGNSACREFVQFCESLSERPKAGNPPDRDTEIQKDSERYRRDKERVRLPADARLQRLPFKEFISKAAEISVEASGNPTVWQSETWEFVRLCKTHPKLSALTADQAYNAIPWEYADFGEDHQMKFIMEWDRVRCLPGVSPLEWAADKARRQPLLSTRKHFKAYNEFCSIAAWLQVLVGVENPIFLPTRQVGEILGKSHDTVADMCKLAVNDGLLVKVEKHTQKRATRYRFAVERYRILSERT